VPDYEWRGDVRGGPGIPVAYVEIGAADRSRLDLEEDLIRTEFGHRYIDHFQPGAG
jgi:hypothetical protein